MTVGITVHAPAAGAQQAMAGCTPDQPVHVAVLVDNSSSVLKYAPQFRSEFHDWLEDLWTYLRPGDLLGLYRLPTPGRRSVTQAAIAPVGLSGQQSAQQGVQNLTAQLNDLHTTEDARSDLAAALTGIGEWLRQPPGLRCHPLLVLITDGSLAPFDSITRTEAARRFQIAADTLRTAGVRLVILRLGDDSVPAFDPEKRGWIPVEWGGIDPDLSARQLLETVATPQNVHTWSARAQVAAHVFDRSEFAQARGLRWLRGFDLRLLHPGTSYLIYRGSASATGNPLLSCSHSHDEHDGVRHFVSSWTANGTCWHHLMGNVAELVPQLSRLSIDEFAWTGSGALFTESIPDTLKSLGQLVVSERPGQDCRTAEVDRRRYGQTFPARGWAYPRVQVELASTSPHSRRARFELYRVPGTSCFAPVPGQTPQLDSSAYEPTELILDMRLLQPDPGPSSPFQVTGALSSFPWQRLHRVRKVPFVGWPFAPERWYLYGRVQIPGTVKNPVAVFGADLMIPLDRFDDCGEIEDERLVCMGVDTVLSDRPSLNGRLLLDMDGFDGVGGDVPYPFGEPDLLNHYGTLTKSSAILLCVLLAVALAGGFSWHMQPQNVPVRRRLRLLAASERTYARMSYSIGLALFFVLAWDTYLWIKKDPQPLSWSELADNMVGWLVLFGFAALATPIPVVKRVLHPIIRSLDRRIDPLHPKAPHTVGAGSGAVTMERKGM